MKTNFNPSSTCVSAYMSARNFARNSANNFRRIAVLLVLLLSFAFGAKAADYVITYTTGGTTYYVGMDNNNQLVAKTTPDATCVWQGYYNGDYNLGSTRINIRNKNNTNYYLYYDGSSIVASTTAQRRWYGGNGSSIYYNNNGGTYRYIHNSGSTITTSNSATNAFIPYTVTVTDVVSTSTNPTINGADVLTATGNSTYTATGAAYQAGGYTNYRFNNTDHFFSGNTAITPANATLTYAWSLESNSYATVNNSGVVTVSSLPQSDVTLTLTVTATVTGGTPAAPAGTTLVGSKEITILGSVPEAPTISVSGTTVTIKTDAPGETSIRYTIDGTNPTATTGTLYSGTFNLDGTTSPVTIKAVTVRNGNVSAITTQVVTLTLPAPLITFDAEAGTATISSSIAGATIYYTTDGSDPTITSSQYTGTLTGLVTMTTIKAIAVKDGWNNSPVASVLLTISSGVDGKVVTLFDYEDHNWSYYQAASNLPDGYPVDYLSSPDPRNVKITYQGGEVSGASVVAISALDGEGQNTMVYYKTLEKSVLGMTGDYPYTVISNPFSKRPRANGSTGTNGFYGFAGWKVVSGGEYISEYNDGQTLPLDATIHFTNLDNNYTPNCTSGEVVFEATWTPATVKTGSSAQSFDRGTYETNFWVLTGNPTGTVTVPANCTMTARYPDGTVSWDGNFNRAITAGGNNAKVEFVNMNSTQNVNANGYTFTMGRGIVNSNNGGTLYGVNSNKACTNTVKIESGTYSDLRNFGQGISAGNSVDQLMIVGCDYDRAKNDNTKLRIRESMYVGYDVQLNRATNSLYVRCYVKSGNLGSSVNVAGNNGYDGAGGTNTYYFSVASTHNAGRRFLCVEGGRLDGIAGGMDETNNQSTTGRSFDLRVRGTAQIDGVVYGAAEFAGARGTRTMVFTGGIINGWIAAGANGTQSSGGLLAGSSYLYFGGKAKTDSGNSNQVMNRAVGGNVFGAGCGHNATSNSGQVDAGTNVVVADEAYVERGVYGGGSYGFTEASSKIYITGGHVDGNIGGTDGTDYDETVTGGVFGGACQNRGGVVNVFMTGGKVNGGLYGGSNKSGTISSNVTMQINGGQVGTSSQPANIHGGGYGKNTAVEGSIDMTLGIFGQETKGVEVWGDVYGGSALGYVNFSPTINNNQIMGGNYTQNTYTNVTMNKATINGSLYGGALGDASTPANVYGPVEVKVHGGSVKTTDGTGENGSGGVYGANNINGAPQRSVTVDIYGTDPAPSEGTYALGAVYGGGNKAPYNGTPIVTVHKCDNSIEYVYGGGNAASVNSTNVTIWGGNKIGNVFGGGNGESGIAADVNGNAVTKIYGGTILNVYGGSNALGKITGEINVTVDSQGEGGNAPCLMNIGDVYGGGNRAASNVGNLNIVCTGTDGYINRVFGGANAAEITGNIELAINGGNIGSVFGGNNSEKSIEGNVTVNIGTAPNACGIFEIGNVHGGGYGKATGVTGNVEVNIAGGTINGDVYGGSALGKVNTSTSNTTAVNLTGGVIHGDAYGGGLGDSDTEADVNGNVTVTLNGTAFTLATTTDDEDNTIPTSGRVFGCNNINGSPKGTVLVKVLNTVARDGEGNVKAKPTKNSGVYELQAVYGGGNLAAYKPTNPTANGQFTSYTWGINAIPHDNLYKPVQVVIDGCNLSSIEYVYGGGNAAATPATDVTILGSYEIGSVFGGGNGKDRYTLDGGANWNENKGADVGIIDAAAYATDKSQGKYGTGDAMTSVLGGTVHNIYGGSNTLGNIVGSATAYMDAASDCPLDAGDIYGGGNEAYMDGNSGIQLGCIEYLKEIYGGARNADVGGDINLTITSGHFDRVFGGNNLGGTIKGSITVNIEETGCNPITIGELYGCGNKAPYTTPGDKHPTINIRSFTSIGNVYGGGLGEEAVVTGNPTVNINVAKGANSEVDWSYNGSTVNFEDGSSVTLPLHEKGKIGAIGTVFGGGNAAAVIGDTQVNIGTEASKSADIRGNVYGGGNQADVTGQTNVVIGG